MEYSDKVKYGGKNIYQFLISHIWKTDCLKMVGIKIYE